METLETDPLDNNQKLTIWKGYYSGSCVKLQGCYTFVTVLLCIQFVQYWN